MADLEKYNKKGWIPGPKEEEEAYLKRIKILEHFFSYPPEDIDHFLTDTDWKASQKKTEELYDFSADWVVGHYSNRQLTFFQGAATWISYEKEVGIPVIQLKEQFETGSLLRMYRKEEVLAHEAVHAVRMEFEEPLFEEIFAYQTSPYSWRRFFGPIFQKPWEIYLFIVLLFIPIFFEISELLVYTLPKWNFFKYLPLVFFVGILSRLLFFQITLRITLKRIQSFLQNSKKKWAVCFRLRDKEIFQFAYLSKKRLASYITEQKSFRWKFLKKHYFSR